MNSLSYFIEGEVGGGPVSITEGQSQEAVVDTKLYFLCSQDMQANSSTVVEMMKLALWWLQTDPMRRHSMSSVVKVLKGGINAHLSLDYNFTDPRMQKKAVKYKTKLTQLMPIYSLMSKVMRFVAHSLSSATSAILGPCT
ncbi:hypothetical protein Tco_0913481, partial [Tanacetum coccineum]